MFTQTFVVPQTHARRPILMATSFTIQATAVVVLLVGPLIRPLTLSPDDMRLRPPQPFFRKVTLETPAQTVTTTKAATSAAHIVRQFFHPIVAPTSVPRSISTIVDAPEFQPGGPVGTGTGNFGTDFGNVLSLPEPKPVRTEPKPVQRVIPEVPKGPITVGGSVQAAKLVFGPRPAYPALARAARVQGVVKLRAVIATTGQIKNLELIGGPPLLVKAAYDAVAQWRYQPTLLNGGPVEVLTEIDVIFTLSQ